MKLYNVDPFPGPLEQGGLGPRIEVRSRDLGDNFLISRSAPLPNRSAKSGWNEMLPPEMSSPRRFPMLAWFGKAQFALPLSRLHCVKVQRQIVCPRS